MVAGVGVEGGVVEAVLRLGAAPDVEGEVGAVVCGVGGEAQLLEVRALVDQAVGLLRGAQGVPVDALEVALVLGGHGAGLGEAVVEEAAGVGGPGDAGELAPADDVREVGPVFQVAHVEVLPVASAARDAVRGEAPVAGEAQVQHRRRAVRAEGVGVEHGRCGGVEAGLGVEHGLVLQPAVLPVVVALPLALGDAVAGVVPEEGEALPEALPDVPLAQEGGREGVLGLHPGHRLRGVRVLQPAVGVGDGGAVEVVDDVAPGGGGVGQSHV